MFCRIAGAIQEHIRSSMSRNRSRRGGETYYIGSIENSAELINRQKGVSDEHRKAITSQGKLIETKVISWRERRTSFRAAVRRNFSA